MYRDDFQSTQRHQTNKFADDYLNEVPYEDEYDEDDNYYYGDKEMTDASYNGEGVDTGSMSLTELVDQCFLPVVSQVFDHFKLLLLFCLLFKLCQHALYKGVSSKIITHSSYTHLLNLISTTLGIIILYSFYHNNCIFIIIIISTIFPLLIITHNKCKLLSGFIVSAVIIIYLITCELFIVNKAVWHNIRGTQMIVCMKLISLSFDLTTRPYLLAYLGYVLHMGSLIFGPWVSFQDHSLALSQPQTHFLDFYWVMGLLKTASSSLSCLTVSTCLSAWIIPDATSSIWLIAYRDALSFRFSHYFVCKASQLTLMLAGGGEVSVVKVVGVEYPRSLSSVVAVWNAPMHKWLKTYVFKAWRPQGTAIALLCTYLASSLLHGFNFQLSAVLLSLGLYTYVEHKVRGRLSEWMGACVASKACKNHCKHHYQASSMLCSVVNLLLTTITIFHLSYLGLMFDSSQSTDSGYSMSHTLNKWSQFNYCSHIIIIITYLTYLLTS